MLVEVSVKRSENHQRIIRELSENYQRIIRESSENHHRIIIESSKNHQRIIRELSEVAPNARGSECEKRFNSSADLERLESPEHCQRGKEVSSAEKRRKIKERRRR